MKRFFLFLLVGAGMILSTNAFAKNHAYKANKDELMRKARLDEPPNFGPWQTSYPYPFVKSGDPIENPKNVTAVSTGYYWADSYDRKAVAPWRPDAQIMDTTEDALNWRRILSGPNQRPMSYWEEHPDEGYRFFRNPADENDSTDNAIAGPIPIGFTFVFNGIEYDSFYVSTNGCIVLSNSRYFYDSEGNRQVRSNNYGAPDNCYNPMSGDWFVRGNRSGDGTDDNTPDDFGWRGVTGQVDNGYTYELSDGTQYPSNITLAQHAPIIAPFFGELYLPQWNKDDRVPTDRGKVFFYRDPNRNKLIIYFVNIMIHGRIQAPGMFPTTIGMNLQPWENGYLAANAQIILDRRDSSIQFVYEKFSGHYASWNLFLADEMFRYNTHCGVFGYVRDIDYDTKEALQDPSYTGTLPWAEEYYQFTYAWSKYMQLDISFPKAGMGIKFKPWKNTLRVCDISFRVRKQEENSPEFSEKILTSKVNNYELLAGHEQIGQMQPVAIVENLSNDIQGPNGVNFQPQDLNFRVRCAIIEQATRRPLYNTYVKVDSLNLANKSTDVAYEKVILSKVKKTGADYEADTANSDYYDSDNHLDPYYDGIPPYGFVTIYFRPFEPNELYSSHIGLMKCYVMADPSDPNSGEGYGDMWPFDDTMSVKFWVMRHIEADEQFTDDVTEYHVIPVENSDGTESLTPIPSVKKWVSINTTVVSGESVSRNPLPPRGDYYCANKELYPTYKVSSPTMRMIRNPNLGPGQTGPGSEIRSFPIDLYGKEGAVLSLAVQRTAKKSDWPRGWSDLTIVGVEHRVVSSNWYAVVQNPDELRVEFARPSPNWRSGKWIANIPKANWRYHPRRGGAKAETKMSAYTLFGGGGHMVGFLETDKDSALAPPVLSGNRKVNGLRYDYFDDGIDFEYHKIIVPIPDTFIRAENEGAKYFRFRIQVYAKNNQLSITTIPDDLDEFFVDNVRILYAENEDVDIEITKAAVDWPYTITPASQAVAIPIRLRLSNNTSWNAPSFWVKAKILPKALFDGSYFLDKAWVWRGDPNDTNMVKLFRQLNNQARDSARQALDQKTIYCRTKLIPLLRPGADEEFTMPEWNARLTPPGDYVIIGSVYVPGGDLEPLNDTTYSEFKLVFGPVFAYDPVTKEDNLNQASNDVPNFAHDYGRGLTLKGYTMGGEVSPWNPSWSYGDLGGQGGSGQIAMKFVLVQADTIFGYSAYFGEKNQSPDYISYALYDGENTPSNLIDGSVLESRRGWDDIEQKYYYGQRLVNVLLPKGIVLPKGTYWLAIRQLGEDGIELGASKARSGMRSTNRYVAFPPSDVKNGSAGIFLNVDKMFRERAKFGGMVNKNFFAYENGLGSGEWQRFTPTQGNPGYAHLTHTGISPQDGQTRTYSRGSWIPLLRPYLGNRWYNTTPKLEICPEIPVELTYFKGFVRNGYIDLLWETASELNNDGFYVERRVVGKESEGWKTLPGFVQGYGTSTEPREYNYVDKDVTPNTTYQYRLRQVDLDGTQSCDDFSDIVTLTYTAKGQVILYQNAPNPVKDGTTIRFSIPEASRVTLEIVDIYGNVIATPIDREMSAGEHSVVWQAKDSNGEFLPSGAYIYRLKVGNEILSNKMTIVR